MLAMFFDRPERAHAAARQLDVAVESIDGPFVAHSGEAGEAAVRIYTVPHGADAAYAAGRLAARRGARVLIPVCESAILASVSRKTEIGPGDIVPAKAVWDLASLEPLVRLLPDSAAELPIDLDPLMPDGPLWKGGAGPLAVGTVPFVVKSSHFLRELYDHSKIGLLDLQLAGYVAAAKDEDLPVKPLCAVTRVLSRKGVVAESALVVEKKMQEIIGEIFDAARNADRG